MEHEKDERTLGLSTAQVVGSVLAAVTGAVLASTMGVTGTVIGAAVASLVATIGSAIYTWSLRRTTVAVRKTAAQVRQAALESGPLPRTVAQGPLRTIKERAAASTAEQGPDRQEQDQDPDQDPDGQQPEEPDPDEDSWRRSIPWGKVLLASLTVTVLALAGITVVEAIAGKPISSVTGRSVHIDLPRSRVARPTIQSANWFRSGLSSPSRLRSISIVSCVTAPPSPRSFTSTTSPGTTRSMKNTSTATPISVGIIIRVRLIV